MMSMNMSVEVALGGGNARLMKKARDPRANWQLLQHKVEHLKTQKTVILDKWLELVKLKAKVCNISLVETMTASTSKTGATLNQLVSVNFKVTAHSAPTPLPAVELQPNEEKPPSTVKFNLTNEYSQDESYLEAKKVFTAQQSHGEELFIKVLGFFRELPLDAAALARLLIFFSISSIIKVFKENLPEEAIPTILLSMVIVFAGFTMTSNLGVHQTPTMAAVGINHLAPNPLRDGMQIATHKQYIPLFHMLCCVGLMNLSGTHAGDSSGNIGHSSNAVDGDAREKGDYFKVLAALSLALMISGGAAAWSWMSRRPAIREFDVNGGLMRSPTLRKSNPISVLPPVVA